MEECNSGIFSVNFSVNPAEMMSCDDENPKDVETLEVRVEMVANGALEVQIFICKDLSAGEFRPVKKRKLDALSSGEREKNRVDAFIKQLAIAMGHIETLEKKIQIQDGQIKNLEKELQFQDEQIESFEEETQKQDESMQAHMDYISQLEKELEEMKKRVKNI